MIHQTTKRNVNYLIKRDDCIFCIKMLKCKQYKGTTILVALYNILIANIFIL